MNFVKKIKKSINNICFSIRNLFIKEKKKYISVRTFDNINFNFKNLQIYSEIGLYKTLFSLFFIVIFLSIIIYFAYIDFKLNIDKNKELFKVEPLELVVENPINIDLPQDYQEVVYKIRRGDNLSDILTNFLKIEQSDAYSIIYELRKVYNINNLKIGQKLFIKYKNKIKNNNNRIENIVELEELKIVDDDSLKKITVSKNNDGNFIVNKEDVVFYQSYNKYIVKISNSLYVDSVEAGVPTDIILNLINYYSFDIDFQRDIRSGDWLEIVFEAFYTENGKKVKNGSIIYANLYANSKNNEIYKFNDEKSKNKYFDKNGISTQKSLLKTPINGARISSGYSNKRKHPVLGYTRAHKGIDFAAPVGTPFYAAGNGKVTKIITGCRNGDRYCGGGFGNYISIRHNNTYTTEYAHISRIAKNIRVGSSVQQGDVIAYVGTTGLSSGPHLHYGIIFNGKRINPASIKNTPLKRLTGKDLLSFTETRDKINSLRATAVNQNMLIKEE